MVYCKDTNIICPFCRPICKKAKLKIYENAEVEIYELDFMDDQEPKSGVSLKCPRCLTDVMMTDKLFAKLNQRG